MTRTANEDTLHIHVDFSRRGSLVAATYTHGERYGTLMNFPFASLMLLVQWIEFKRSALETSPRLTEQQIGLLSPKEVASKLLLKKMTYEVGYRAIRKCATRLRTLSGLEDLCLFERLPDGRWRLLLDSHHCSIRRA